LGTIGQLKDISSLLRNQGLWLNNELVTYGFHANTNVLKYISTCNPWNKSCLSWTNLLNISFYREPNI